VKKRPQKGRGGLKGRTEKKTEKKGRRSDLGATEKDGEQETCETQEIATGAQSRGKVIQSRPRRM